LGKWEIIKVRIPDLIIHDRIREAYDELKAIEGKIQTQQRDFAARTRLRESGNEQG
jgi:ABC-type enterochelin transport system substrate-binding protein